MSACRWLTPDRLDLQVLLFQSGRGNMSRGGGASYTGDPRVNQDGVWLSVSVWAQLQRRIHIALHSNPPKRIEPLIFNEGRWFSCVKTPADQISEGRVNTQALEPVGNHSKPCCSAIWLWFFILRAFAERGETEERSCQREEKSETYSERASVSVSAQALCGHDPDRPHSQLPFCCRELFQSTAGRASMWAAWLVWDH